MPIFEQFKKFIAATISTSSKDKEALLKLQLSDLRLLILEQKREIELLIEKLKNAEAGSKPEIKQVYNVVDLLEKYEFDGFYMAFEDHFRGTPQEIKQRLEVYLPIVMKAVDNCSSGGLLIDVGCGRGEWLELLRDKGYSPTGIDTNRVALARCREMGLNVIESDVLKYLRSLEISSCSLITGFHLLEHLPFDVLLKLMQESFRALKPGGAVIFETPDPENVIVGTRNFSIDPTHRNPLPDETLAFIAEYCGFVNVEILKLHKISDPLLTDNPHLNEIQRRFFMSQDYAVIGYRPK